MTVLRSLCLSGLFLMASLAFGITNTTKWWGSVSYFGRTQEILYTIEPQIRLIDRAGTYEQTLLNAGVGQIIHPNLQLWLGQTYTNYSNRNNTEEDVNKIVTNEYRIWEQVMWRKPFWDKLASRFRLEERRAFQTGEWAIRLRERGYLTIPLSETISFALNNEVFFNLKKAPWVATHTFDQNRLFVGVFYPFTPKIGLNISYMNQYIARTPAEMNHGMILNLIAYMY